MTAVSHKADLGYTAIGVVVAIGGLVVGQMLFDDTGHSFVPALGVGVFALVYVLAQAVERVVELVLAVVESVAKAVGKELAPTTKAKAVKSVALASTPTAGDLEKAASAEADTRALAFGLALGLAFLACGYFQISLLQMIGVRDLDSDTEQKIALAVSGLVVAGGSKPLHDLISKVQKSKQKDEQATG